MSDNFSWYFEPENMIINSIQVKIPTNHSLFSNIYQKDGKTLKQEQGEDKNTFFVINNEFYLKSSLKENNVFANLYFMKELELNSSNGIDEVIVLTPEANSVKRKSDDIKKIYQA